MFVKITNGSVDTYPYSVGQLRRDNPNTSFPKTVSAATMAAYGMYPVSYEAAPDYDAATHRLEISNTPSLVNGEWKLTKTVVALTANEIQARDENTAYSNRTKRNKLLADSDWTQMNDSPLSSADKTAWAVYRDELRNITDQDYWPNMSDDDWPVSP